MFEYLTNERYLEVIVLFATWPHFYHWRFHISCHEIYPNVNSNPNVNSKIPIYIIVYINIIS
jgi:hypothetical protein